VVYPVSVPTITDWISSIAAIVGGLAGVGALIVSFLSYRRSSRALAADARTRAAVASTFQAVEALGSHDEQSAVAGRRSAYAQAAARTQQLLDEFAEEPRR